jgi:hypothetical protein
LQRERRVWCGVSGPTSSCCSVWKKAMNIDVDKMLAVFSGTMGWVFVMMKEARVIAIGVDSVGGRSAACAL